jgi:hypothetical protein
MLEDRTLLGGVDDEPDDDKIAVPFENAFPIASL